MSLSLRLIIALVALFNLILVVRNVRKGRIQIEYSLFWVIFSFLLVVLAIFPKICYYCSAWIGFISPSNFVFAFMLFVLLLRNFVLSKEVSRLDEKVKELAQSIALSEKND